MTPMRRGFVMLIALAVVACDGIPTATPKGPSGALGEIAKSASALAAQGTLTDAVFESFLADVDLKKTYGARADEIVAQLEKTRSSVIAARRSSSIGGGGRLASVLAVFGVFIVPEFAQKLADSLDEFTKRSVTFDLPGHPYSSTEDGGTVTTTTTLNIADTISSAGARVTLTMRWTFHSLSKDKVTGAVLNEINDERTMVGSINVCPDAQGAAAASIEVHSQFTGVKAGTTTTRATSSKSNFVGRVDDSANLKMVEQTMQDKQSWETTSGNGDYEANVAATWTFQSGSSLMGELNTAGFSGGYSANGDGARRATSLSATTLVLDAYALSEAYKSAQRLWRNGRCVMVTAPEYTAETPIEIREQEKSQHDETVDQSSETKFTVNLKHRFGGSVSAPITAALVSGQKTLEPSRLESSGSLTYKAPDEQDKKATAKLQSTSKRGIGTLVLDFHTGKQALTLKISGSVTLTRRFIGTVEVTDTVTIGPVVFMKKFDDTWEGAGMWQAQTRSFVSVAGATQTCTGSQSGTITMLATYEERAGKKVWVVNPLDGSTDGTANSSCPGEVNVEADAADNFLGSFDEWVIPEEGAQITVHGSGGNASLGQFIADGIVNGQTRR
jgi:hypothetical protein